MQKIINKLLSYLEKRKDDFGSIADNLCENRFILNSNAFPINSHKLKMKSIFTSQSIKVH
jgi:hypothetical protein